MNQWRPLERSRDRPVRRVGGPGQRAIGRRDGDHDPDRRAKSAQQPIPQPRWRIRDVNPHAGCSRLPPVAALVARLWLQFLHRPRSTVACIASLPLAPVGLSAASSSVFHELGELI